MSKKENASNNSKIIGLVIGLCAAVCVLGFILVRLMVANAAPKTFYEGTTVNGQDVSGLTAEEAQEKLAGLVKDYRLNIRFATSEREVTAADVALAINEENHLEELVKRQNKLDEAGVSYSDLELRDLTLFTYDDVAIAAMVHGWQELTECADEKAVDAVLVYDAENGEFRIAPETVGGTISEWDMTTAIEEELENLAGSLNAMENGLYGQPIRTEAGDVMQKALSNANTKLNLNITYHFEVAGKGVSGDETVDKKQLQDWLYVEEDGITVGVDTDPVQTFAAKMKKKYSVKDSSASRSKFVTTGGTFVDVDFPACDETVDDDALFNDIIEAINIMADGVRKAPYASTSIGVSGTTDLGGSYVEIDLDNQHLWVYKDHQLVIDGPICSGSVANGCETPGGLYTIKEKETDRWLNGPTWHDWVSYWMPFNGGIGLHDATWRSAEEFGGDVYLEAGSHGCINMPLNLAEVVFANVDVGSYVILYGGETLYGHDQNISGTSSYYKYIDSGDFRLDCDNDKGIPLSYSSSDSDVVTVDENGYVTIHGIGSATIIVSAPAQNGYFAAEKRISITVANHSVGIQNTHEKDKDTSKDKDKESTKPAKPSKPSEPVTPTKPGEPTKPAPEPEKPAPEPEKPEPEPEKPEPEPEKPEPEPEKPEPEPEKPEPEPEKPEPEKPEPEPEKPENGGEGESESENKE